MGLVLLQLAEALLEHTNHLPESHYVRFRARCLHLDTVSLLTSFDKDNHSMEVQAKAILQTLEENSSELALSMLGETSVGDEDIEAVVAGESVKPLVALGTVKEKAGDLESAVVLCESALEHLDAAEAAGYWCGGSVQREIIGGRLRHIKHKMGLISPSEDVADRRENLNRLIQEKRDEALIATAKHKLAMSLKKTDPPQYFEAIKLLKESSAVLARMFGPEHEMTAINNLFYDETRKEYRQYLQDIAKKGKEQT